MTAAARAEGVAMTAAARVVAAAMAVETEAVVAVVVVVAATRFWKNGFKPSAGATFRPPTVSATR